MLRQIISASLLNRQAVTRLLRLSCSTQASQSKSGFVQTAESWGCWSVDAQKAIDAVPKLDKHSYNQVHGLFSTLAESGFTAGQTLKICCEYPEILELEPSDISQRIEYWTQCNLTEENVRELLHEHPTYFSYPPEYMHKQINTLRTLLHQSRMFKVLMSAPELMNESRRDLEAKIHYLLKEMRVDLETIVANPAVLGVSLWQIKCRHLFLYRAGIYKTPNPKASIPVKNPNLTHVISNDIEVALKGLPLNSEEYTVFEEMLRMEEQDEIEEEQFEKEFDNYSNQ